MVEPAPHVLRILRESHEERVLTALRRHGGMSRVDLGRHTNLSRATLSSIVRRLVSTGTLLEVPATDTPRGRGRPPMHVTLNPAGGLALGVDLGHRRIHVVAANVAHEIVGSGSVACAESATWSRRLRMALDLVDDVAARTELSLQGLRGIGVGLVGPVATAGGTSGPHHARRVALAQDTLVERFGVPVFVDNNTRLAGLAEAIWGSGNGCQNVLYLRLSYGIGGGLVLDGHLFSGSAGGAGELGHVSVDPNGPDCPCGGRGCLERYAGLAEVLQQCGVRDLGAVLERLRLDDPRVVDVVRRTGERVGRVLASACNVVNPELVVVGGELVATGRHLLDPARAAVRLYTHRHVRRQLRVRAAELGEEGSARGAIALVLRNSALLADYPGGAARDDAARQEPDPSPSSTLTTRRTP